MHLDITVLGVGSARPVKGRHPSGHAVQHGKSIYLVDCGEGSQLQLVKYGLALERVEAIFITHLHADHALGLVGLLSSLAMGSRRAPVHVYAHGALEELLFRDLDFFVTHRSFDVEFHALPEGAGADGSLLYEQGGLRVYGLELQHRIASMGFLFELSSDGVNIRREVVSRYGLGPEEILRLKGGESVEVAGVGLLTPGECLYRRLEPVRYAYASDTVYLPSLSERVRGVDLLYHEATYDASLSDLAERFGHSTAGEAARVAQAAGVGHLMLGHFSGRYADPTLLLEEARAIFPDSSLARQGNRYRIASR